MKLLITGGAGFLGSNLAQEAIKKKYELVIFDNLSRIGSEKNLRWLQDQGVFQFCNADIRNQNDVETIVSEFKPDAIFHLAGQVAMTTSIDNPRKDFEINTLGSFNILEAVRKYSKNTFIIYSSTNKVYGDLELINYEEKEKRYIAPDYSSGFTEDVLLNFSSPYGCSKGAADQYMLDYYKVFGIKTVVLRHSSMYGGRQFATYDQGWICWFCTQAILKLNNEQEKPFTISGNGKQVRDLLHAEDMVRLYYELANNIDKVCGNVFNIGGGINNSLSLLELFDFLERELNVKLEYTKLPVRNSDQKVFVADLTKIRKFINWKPEIDKENGIRKMLDWLNK